MNPGESPLHYLAAGLLCLFAVAWMGGRLGLAGLGAALLAAGCALFVYRWWVPVAAAGAALVGGYATARLLHSRPRAAAAVLALGLLLAGFSVLGPREGLF